MEYCIDATVYPLGGGVALHTPMPMMVVVMPFVVHVALHSEPLEGADGSEHSVVVEFNATHLVTAVAGWIMLVAKIPAMIKCFFIRMPPCFFFRCANEKPPEKIRVVGGSKLS